MRKTPNLRTIAALFFGVVLLLYVFFSVYMLTCSRPDVYQARQDCGYRKADCSMVLQPDPAAPAGVRKVFRWTLDPVSCNDSSITFYLVHHDAQVYLDGELVYSRQAGEKTPIGRSTGSYWVSIPIHPEDSGAEIAVVATPVYRSVVNREIEILVGFRFSIFYDCLMKDAQTLLIGLICTLVGLFVVAMQGYTLLHQKAASLEMFYLGLFAVLLGIWRMSDTRATAFLFPDLTMPLGYVTLACLMLCVIPMLLFMRERLADFERAPLLHGAVLASAVAQGMLILQVLGIADLREMLTVCHIVIAGAVILVTAAVVLRCRRRRSADARFSVILIAVLAVGSALDFFSFYWNKGSRQVMFSAFAFVVYVVILFTNNLFETKNKAYTDPNTGLFNKNRWDELMHQKLYATGDVGVIMLDLNGLKHVNDTLGHEAGDRMIFNFANILRNTLPPGCVICRWGGDEFTVMLFNATAQKLEQAVSDLRHAAQLYNDAGNTPRLSFAAGCALASEFPEISREELLGKADARMYRDKREWYAEHPGKK